MNKRLVVTVDGMQVVKIAKYGVIPKYKLEQWRREFIKFFDVPMGLNGWGVKIQMLEPRKDIKAWYPLS